MLPGTLELGDNRNFELRPAGGKLPMWPPKAWREGDLAASGIQLDRVEEVG